MKKLFLLVYIVLFGGIFCENLFCEEECIIKAPSLKLSHSSVGGIKTDNIVFYGEGYIGSEKKPVRYIWGEYIDGRTLSLWDSLLIYHSDNKTNSIIIINELDAYNKYQIEKDKESIGYDTLLIGDSRIEFKGATWGAGHSNYPDDAVVYPKGYISFKLPMWADTTALPTSIITSAFAPSLDNYDFMLQSFDFSDGDVVNISEKQGFVYVRADDTEWHKPYTIFPMLLKNKKPGINALNTEWRMSEDMLDAYRTWGVFGLQSGIDHTPSHRTCIPPRIRDPLWDGIDSIWHYHNLEELPDTVNYQVGALRDSCFFPVSYVVPDNDSIRKYVYDRDSLDGGYFPLKSPPEGKYYDGTKFYFNLADSIVNDILDNDTITYNGQPKLLVDADNLNSPSGGTCVPNIGLVDFENSSYYGYESNSGANAEQCGWFYTHRILDMDNSPSVEEDSTEFFESWIFDDSLRLWIEETYVEGTDYKISATGQCVTVGKSYLRHLLSKWKDEYIKTFGTLPTSWAYPGCYPCLNLSTSIMAEANADDYGHRTYEYAHHGRSWEGLGGLSDFGGPYSTHKWGSANHCLGYNFIGGDYMMLGHGDNDAGLPNVDTGANWASVRKQIAQNLAKHRWPEVAGHLHGMEEIRGLNRVYAWLDSLDIPVVSIEDLVDIARHHKTNPYCNIIPPLHVDLDEDGIPDGWNGPPNNVSFNLADTTAPNGGEASIEMLGDMIGVDGLYGVERFCANGIGFWAKRNAITPDVDSLIITIDEHRWRDSQWSGQSMWAPAGDPEYRAAIPCSDIDTVWTWINCDSLWTPTKECNHIDFEIQAATPTNGLKVWLTGIQLKKKY